MSVLPSHITTATPYYPVSATPTAAYSDKDDDVDGVTGDDV